MPIPRSRAVFHPEVTSNVPPEVMAAIRQIVRDSRQPLEVAFTRAIAPSQASLKAISEGEHVGSAGDADRLDVESTGLIAAGG